MHNVDCCIVNAIRRTILSSIPTVGFIVEPYEKDTCIIETNTSNIRSNEVLKHRLSNIPVNCSFTVPFKDSDMPSADDLIENYELVINKVGAAGVDHTFITTRDFVVRNKSTQEELTEEQRDNLFSLAPTNDGGSKASSEEKKRYYTQLAYLVPNAELKLRCAFSRIEAASGVYRMASVCAYGCAIDEDAAQIAKETALHIQHEKIKAMAATDEASSDDMLARFGHNWEMLERKRYIIPNEFVFRLRSILPIHTAAELLRIAIDLLLHKLDAFNPDEFILTLVPDTYNVYEYKWVGETFTLGSVLVHYLNELEVYKSTIKFSCKQLHPHDSFISIRAICKFHEKSTLTSIIPSNIVRRTVIEIKKTFGHLRHSLRNS